MHWSAFFLRNFYSHTSLQSATPTRLSINTSFRRSSTICLVTPFFSITWRKPPPPALHTSFPSTSSSILLKICSIKVLLLLIWFYNLYLTVNSLRILGMLRHSACVTRQTHTSRYVLSISSNAAKRRFKDKKIYIVFYYNYINKKCNIFLQKNSRHLWRLRSDSELLIISRLRLPWSNLHRLSWQ